VTEPPAPESGALEASPRIRPFLGTVLGGSVEEQQPDSVLRPFVVTAGRVRGVDPSVGVETQVTARDPDEHRSHTGQPTLTPEQRAIVELCAEPVSVAEIAAHLRLHLGVTRVLVGDLRVAGYVEVHTMDVSTPHAPETILRVMRGLRAIT